jgi:hypothetical protein
MRPIKRMALLLALALLLAGAYAVPASAHIISEAQAYGVAGAMAESAYNQTPWSNEWGDECSRQTPWRFSCEIDQWSEAEHGADCWRNFDVTSPIWGSRLRVVNLTPWRCNPWP